MTDAARGSRHELTAQLVPLAAVWAVSRGLIVLMGVLVMLTSGASLSDVIGNWDVQHFIFIAEHGYADHPEEMAFFPGLPVLMAAGGLIGLPGDITGMVLSLGASFLAAWALQRLGGFWAAVVWLFAPAAVFTTVGYTEALFCAAAFWAWERARADRWGQAAALAALACTFRVSGLFLIGALGLLALSWPPVRRSPLAVRMRQAGVRIAWLVIPVAVIVAYMVYLWTLTGSWSAWFSAQESGWQRTFAWPWEAVRTTVEAVLPGGQAQQMGWGEMFRLELVSFAVGLLATGWLLRRRQWAEAGWIGSQLFAFAISYWLMSLNRAVLLWFPLWIILAEVIAQRRDPTAPGGAAGGVPDVHQEMETVRRADPRHRFAVLVYLAGSVTAMLWWSWMFFTGAWAS